MRSEPRGLALGLVAGVITLGAGLGGAVFLWQQREFFVPEVAVQWGSVNQPSGYMPFLSAVVFNAIIIMFVPGFLVLMGIISGQSRQVSPVAAGMATFLGVLMHGAVWQQRGVDADGVTRVTLTGPMLWAVAATVLVSLGMVLLGRRLGVPNAPPPPVPGRSEGRRSDQVAAELTDAGLGELDDEVLGRPDPDSPDHGSRVAPRMGRWSGWSGRTRWSGLLGRQILALTVLVVATLVAAGATGSLLAIAISGAVGLAMLGCAPFAVGRVQLDSSRVQVTGRGFIGWMEIPLEQIVQATVVQVDPREHGGIGRHITDDGSIALVTGAGAALRIQRRRAPAVLVTVTNAEVAAAALNALVAHRWEDD